MKKTNAISIATRRRDSTWVDALRPGPAQTLSAPSVGSDGGLFGDGTGAYPCSDAIPTVRNRCAEWAYAFGAVEGSGWGGTWKSLNSDPISDVDDHEYLNKDREWPYSDEGAYAASQSGILENGYSIEVWNESPLGSHIATTLNSTLWHGAMVWKNDLHQYIDDTNGYLPIGFLFKVRVDSLVNPIPAVGSGFRDNTLRIELGRVEDSTIINAGGMISTQTSLELSFNRPGSPSSIFGVNRVSHLDTTSFTYNAGSTYYVLACIGEYYTDAKIWNINDEEPEWMVSAGPVALSEYIPGIQAELAPLDWNAGDEGNANGGAVGIGFIRLNPSSNLCSNSSGAHPIIPCDDEEPSSSVGHFMDTLIPKYNTYWIPQSTDVSYYKQIYFDGLPVFEDQHYWLDGLKVHPIDPSIFSDTLATAEVVVQ